MLTLREMMMVTMIMMKKGVMKQSECREQSLHKTNISRQSLRKRRMRRRRRRRMVVVVMMKQGAMKESKH